MQGNTGKNQVFNLKAVLLLVALVKDPDNKVSKKRIDFFFQVFVAKILRIFVLRMV